MKKLLLILLLLPCFVFGQTSDATLTTQAQQIKNETTAGANTANRVGTHLQNLVYSKKSFFTDGTAGGTDTYSVSLDNGAVTSLTSQWFVVKFTNANSGASTLNINAIGAKSLVKTDGTALSSGDIDAGSVHLLSYDGTNLQVLSLGGGGGAGTVTSVAATVPSFLSISGSPVTTSGTLAISLSGTALPVANGGTGQTTSVIAASITNGVTTSAPDQNQVFDALALKRDLTTSPTALTDGGSISITSSNNTLTTTQSTITFSDGWTGNYSDISVTFNTTTATWTFPAGALCRVNGVSTNDNIAVVSATSGSKIEISIRDIDGTNYRVAIANFSE